MPTDGNAPWSLTLSEVGGRLQDLRERMGLTLVSVAQHDVLRQHGIKTDASGLSRIEHGQRRRLSRATVEALLECYRADPAERQEILDLLNVETTPAGRPRPALWRRHAALLAPTQFEGFLKLEPRASVMRNYEPFLVPGLLQTREYAQNVIERMRPDLRPSEVKGLADLRLYRQQRVEEGALRDFRALIEEGALQRVVGGGRVMRGQLERLIEESQRPRNTIRVLPDTIDCHPGLAGAFVLMSFPETTREVVWVETMVNSVYFDAETTTDRYTEVFTDLWERALEPEDTRVRLKEMIKELQQ